MKIVSTLLFAFIVFNLLLLTSPEKGNAGVAIPAFGCCQFEFVCEDLEGGSEFEECNSKGGEIFPGEICIQNNQLCSGNQPESRNVPTLSEWGLIAMAGILGIVGFMVIRRRKATTY